MDEPGNQRRREECERKARRGEMDPRLEFSFQLLMDGTGLPRHQIMDYIFEGNMVSRFSPAETPLKHSELVINFPHLKIVAQFLD